MDFSRLSFIKTTAILLTPVCILSGCGQQVSPPYDALPLRDALRTDPEVMATLSEDSRREIATRLEEAERTGEELVAFAEPDPLTLDNLVLAADALREAAGNDALIIGELSTAEGNAVLDAHVPSDTDLPTAGPLDVHGKASSVAAPFEEAALRGRAGKTLRELVSRTQAKSIVRMTGLPMGAVAWDDNVYVNESWLVALSALEEQSVVTPLPIAAPDGPNEVLETPQPKPLSVDFSPYDLPGNLDACARQVEQTCQCGTTMSCSHVPTDQTFADANAECAWVNSAPVLNASAICILALLSMDAVRECVESASPACVVMPVRTRNGAAAFAANGDCVSILNACLQTGEPSAPAPNSSNCGEACDDCRYCDNEGDDCQQCASDCQTAAQACEACVTICALCAESADRQTGQGTSLPTRHAAVHASSQCSTRPRPGKSPLPAPMGTALWLFAPAAYLFLRNRRRP